MMQTAKIFELKSGDSFQQETWYALGKKQTAA